MRNLLLTIAGFTCLGLGGIGVALPVMPTTPFVLLAAVCFTAGNTNFGNWLRKSPFFGSFIENYRTKQGVEMSVKITGIAFLWMGLAISMICLQTTLGYLLLSLVGAGVTIHLLLLKTKKNS